MRQDRRAEGSSAAFALVLTGKVYAQTSEVPEPCGRAQGNKLLPTGEQVQVRASLSKMDLRVPEGKALTLRQQLALVAKMAS